MEIQELRDKMDYYTECANELINFGNSKEKAFGMGMKDIINIVKLYTDE
jgi:hypothetical protein